ncbi:hypothetical protein [Aquimarina sp. RZ0]|uniref:hypothetical protein n=1 Tax=Aquimarina sp. RZ0 TaxID=2607730 RepID=UPI0011F2DFB4|nr:hypothetical protein [Aquimarina sp. RZ0]KAA1242375.1 hypothetical protein F0000_25915 [Aquimarina sp. RZ0]
MKRYTICLQFVIVFAFVSNNIFSQNSSLSFQEGKETNIIGNKIHDYKLSLTKGDVVQLLVNSVRFVPMISEL